MKTIVISPVYNERNLELFIKKLEDLKKSHEVEVLFINDGSTDNTQEIIDKSGFKSITHKSNQGVGKSLIDGFNYAKLNSFEYCIVIASNGKDDPLQIPYFLKCFDNKELDFIQGSRYLQDGEFKGTPLRRKLATKCFTLFWNILTGFKLHDASNGFRGFKMKIFEDNRINYEQEWLYKYELEYYLLYMIFKHNYNTTEIPVSKNYPRKKNYSKISGFADWWSIARPVIFLKLGLRK